MQCQNTNDERKYGTCWFRIFNILQERIVFRLIQVCKHPKVEKNWTDNANRHINLKYIKNLWPLKHIHFVALLEWVEIQWREGLAWRRERRTGHFASPKGYYGTTNRSINLSMRQPLWRLYIDSTTLDLSTTMLIKNLTRPGVTWSRQSSGTEQ